MPRATVDIDFEGGATATGIPTPEDDEDAANKLFTETEALTQANIAQAEAANYTDAEIDALPEVESLDPSKLSLDTVDVGGGVLVTQFDPGPLATEDYVDAAVGGPAVPGNYLEVDDDDATLVAVDRTIAVQNLTAPRTITLPAASAVPEGALILVFDDTGDATKTNYILVTRAGTDTMPNGLFGTSGVINTAFGWHAFISNGVNAWYIQEVEKALHDYVTGTLQTVADAADTIDPGVLAVKYTSITANRVLTLPAANSLSANQSILIWDASGNCSPTDRIDITAAGADTIVNGFGDVAFLQRPYSWARLVTNGVSQWTSIEMSAATSIPRGSAATHKDTTTALAVQEYVDGSEQIVADVAAAVATSAKVVKYTSITTDRILTLPAANAVRPGHTILIHDASGDSSPTKRILITRAGSDTIINGAFGTTAIIQRPHSWTRIVSNGVDEWFSAELGASPDGTLAANSDELLATQKAINTAVRGAVGVVEWDGAAANHTMAVTDHKIIQTADLTGEGIVVVNLVAASAVAAGTRVTVTDASGSLATTTDNIYIDAAGADTIRNPIDRVNTPATALRQGYGSVTLESDGSLVWTVVDPGATRAYFWWQHANAIAVPTGVWTPLVWNSFAPPHTDLFNVANSFALSATTVDAASNGAALPQGTISVASTAAFPESGYLVITTDTGVDTVVGYTGKTAGSPNTFTGCNTVSVGVINHSNIGIGTLATGDVVTAANVAVNPLTPGLWQITGECAWAKSAVGVRRIRMRDIVNNLPGATGNDTPGLNIDHQHQQVTMQPGAFEGGSPYCIEVFQTSGATLNTTVDGIQAPSLMACLIAAH